MDQINQTKKLTNRDFPHML